MSRQRIHLLNENIVGRIAAGEVVERPASVAKELIENALDAGAKRIDVVIEGGPFGRLRVADDGHGILKEDLPLSTQRHATSKLENPEDLFAIESLGFRGEGLAAIAAVAHMEITSSTGEEPSGYQLVVREGELQPLTPKARPRGTTVEVLDLFFNTPARRKYMKSDAYELRRVSELVQAYGAARPEVHFHLTTNGKRVLELPQAKDQHERMTQIYGQARVDRMIPVMLEEGPMRLEGFLGAPEDSRARSHHQLFFINRRWVLSPLLRQVVRMAYSDLIPPGRHPEACLMLTLPESRVDVNVHPTKREVRLEHERDLYPRLIKLLRSCVEERHPRLHLKEHPIVGDTLSWEAGGSAPEYPETLQRQLYLHLPRSSHQVRDEGNVSTGEGEDILPFRGGTQADEAPANMANLWQLHNTYIFARIQGGLLIIDQHAAHERVLYEQCKTRFGSRKPVSQELLFPTVVDLAPDEFSVLLESQAAMEKLGFHLKLFGGTSVLVHAIPAGVREWKHGAMLKDILDHFSDLPGNLDIVEKVARSVACHGAVKAGQALSLQEMNDLVDQLFATEKPQGDPHGRPVFLRVDLHELHRRFGRSD